MTDVIESRRNHRWVWIALPWVLVLIVGAVVLNRPVPTPGDARPLESSTPSGTWREVPKDNPLEDDDWVLGDVQLNPSWGALTARILNQTADTRSTYFTVTVLSDGHLVGSFSGAVNNIEPGATATATLIGPKIPADGNYTYEIQAG